MIISVHIPKTGGLSFKSLLTSYFGGRLFLDYYDHPMNKTTVIRNILALFRMFNSRKLSKKYDCVHGHFLPIKYRSIRNKSYAIWLRDPAERLTSRYYYWKRKITQNTSQPGKFIKNIDISLAEFCSIKHYQNLYAKYLWGLKIDNFEFVGITENYDNSIEIFRRMFRINYSASITNKNINPEKKAMNYYLSTELKSYILKTNARDYQIYNKALELNRRLEKKFL